MQDFTDQPMRLRIKQAHRAGLSRASLLYPAPQPIRARAVEYVAGFMVSMFASRPRRRACK